MYSKNQKLGVLFLTTKSAQSPPEPVSAPVRDTPPAASQEPNIRPRSFF